ncbi:MAG: carbon-nitrogen hydrolase family protein [Kiritimatiellae bacterium]|nr:carbon-nitrogen hydrolase family protein [Kiritimatiellia bacterium]
MARFVHAAAVLFATRAERGAKDAGRIVLAETRETLDGLRGYGLDLIVLSEGVEAYGLTIETAEEVAKPGPFLSLYLEFAARERCTIAGSAKIREAGRVYNSIVFVTPAGIAGAYHKSFLTDGEIADGLASGRGAVTVETPAGRLGGAICFDLNFGALLDGYRANRPEILCFASMYHGGLMQAQWAYQCRAYFVAALPFIGGGILDPFGRPVALSDCYTQHPCARINLDYVMVHLDKNREKFPDIRRKYRHAVSVDIPADIGPALIVSHTEQRTAAEVVAEFGLEPLDDYLARAIAANEKNRAECAVSWPQSVSG